MKRSEFLVYILEDAMREVRGVTAKAMFGGYGLYKNGAIFSILVEDELYFKVDDKNRAQYEKRGSTPFTYETKKGKRVAMSYWKLPADILEDPTELSAWIDSSILATKRSAAKKKT